MLYHIMANKISNYVTMVLVGSLIYEAIYDIRYRYSFQNTLMNMEFWTLLGDFKMVMK